MTLRLWGQQTLLNTPNAAANDLPAIATLPNGNLIAVWHDAATGDISGRLISPSGQLIGAEIQVAGGVSNATRPAVASVAAGGFVVAWEQDSGVRYRSFYEDGFGGAQFLLEPGSRPAVVGSGAGAGFYMSYAYGTEMRVARFDTAGNFLNAIPFGAGAGADADGDIAVLSDGRVVLAWKDAASTVQAIKLNPNGTFSGGGQTVSAPGAAFPESTVKVTALQGAYLIMWHGGPTGFPSQGVDVYGAIGNNDGSQLTSPFVINTRTFGTQTFGDVVALKDGGFLAVFYDDALGLRAQLFNARGERQGNDILVNTSGAAIPSFGIEATLMADGRVAVVWNGSSADPLEFDGAFMQIIDPRGGYIEGASAAETIYGHDTFDDLVLARGGADTIYGMGGHDAIYAGDGADKVTGGTGNDTVVGGEGGDTIAGDGGDDLLYGGVGDDVIGGGAGADLIFGEIGNDWLEGGAENDTILGSDGGDRLDGGDGNDVLDGGIGNDVLIGGAGNDIVYMDTLGDQVIEMPGGGIDIVYSSAGWLGNANVENLVLTGNLALNATMNNDANLVAGNNAANVINGAGGNDTIDGLGGNDWLGGGDGADRLDGGADNDTIQGGAGADALYGGAGADSFYYASYLDSNPTQGIDSIQDFQVGIDKINLTPARFSASDSVSIVKAYGHAYVFVDLYGDGINDMIIEVIGATSLTGADLSFVPPAVSAIYYGDDAQVVTEAQLAAHHRASWDAVF